MIGMFIWGIGMARTKAFKRLRMTFVGLWEYLYCT
jgi:hypothetical protein